MRTYKKNWFLDQKVEAGRKKQAKKDKRRFKPLKGRDKMARKLARRTLKEAIRRQSLIEVRKRQAKDAFLNRRYA